MNAVSAIPAPVAAEISGPGSFFGSCQIAAGGFESYLQSASETQLGASIISGAPAEFEAPIAYGAGLETSKKPTFEETLEYSEIFLEFVSILKGYTTYKEPEVLSRLKEELGEDAGEEAFETIKEFFEKYTDKFTIEDGGDDPKFSEAMQILFRLIKALDPKYASEVPVEEQQIGLEGILKEILEKIVEEIRGLLANEQQPQTEILLPEEEMLQPKTADAQPKAEILQSGAEAAQPKPKATQTLETAETPTDEEPPEHLYALPELVNILDKYNKEPLLLSRLKEKFGKEAGEEVFEIIKDFLEKYGDKFTAKDSEDSPKFSEAIQILFRLIRTLDPKYVSEIPVEEQQAGLENVLKEILEKIVGEIKGLLANEQIAQPKAEISQPETADTQPKAADTQPKTADAQPQPEISQPKAEISQPKATDTQPKMADAQPKAEVLQTETADAKPQTETEPALVKKEDHRITRLAIELGIEPLGRHEFHKFINDLLERGLLTLDDLGEPVNAEEEETAETAPTSPVATAPKNSEEKKPDFFAEILKNLWESTKTADEPKKEESLSLLKEIAVGRDLGRQLKENLGTGQNAEVLDKTSDKALDSVAKKENVLKEDELNPANIVKPAKHSEAKQESHEKPVQPEVRATWEGSALKIEIVNPKTGEKLQTVETAMPHKMQERIHEFEVIKQIAAQARFTTAPTGEQKLTIQLHPEHLGQVDLRITLNNGEMQIHARVESPTVQNALESHIGLLRDSLEKQGINLERLEVSVEQRDRNSYAFAQEHENQQHGEKNKKRKRGRTSHLAVSIAKDENADTGRRLGYNTMEYLA
jgi:flagellar hook-length control protein FliK